MEHKCMIFKISKNPIYKYIRYDSTDSTKNGFEPLETFECIYCGKKRLWLPYYAEVDYNL